MNVTNRCRSGNHPGNCKHRRRGSSFWMHDPDFIFREIGLKNGDRFLDLGCGPGDYALYASKIVGESGVVYALDRQENLIEELRNKVDSEGYRNIKAMASDITAPLPIEDNCIDVCFMSTVLHTIDLDRDAEGLFREVRRILKPDGRVTVIECKKEDMSFGPPKHMRISEQESEALINRYGFKKLSLVDLGYNYMIQFVTEQV